MLTHHAGRGGAGLRVAIGMFPPVYRTEGNGSVEPVGYAVPLAPNDAAST